MLAAGIACSGRSSANQWHVVLCSERRARFALPRAHRAATAPHRRTHGCTLYATARARLRALRTHCAAGVFTHCRRCFDAA